MLPDDFRDRSARLVDVALTERRRQLPHALAFIDAECAAAGAYQSGRRFLMIHRAIAHELEVRAILIWKSLVRAHQAVGALVPEDLASEFKQAFSYYLRETRGELDDRLEEKIIEAGLLEKLKLDEAFGDSAKKHDVEVDLYVDSLRLRLDEKQGTVMTQNYAFYGAVGAVQAGPGAVANEPWGGGAARHP